MNRQEMLLTQLSEECSEVIQRVTKIQRFGLHEVEPEQSLTNVERLINELNDLWAVIQMLEDDKIIQDHWYSEKKEKTKKEKVEKYLGYSQQCGTLESDALTELRRNWSEYAETLITSVKDAVAEAKKQMEIKEILDKTNARTRPAVVCYCGSLRFKNAFIEAEHNALQSGVIALLPAMMSIDLQREHANQFATDNKELKEKADELHKRKIDICDYVYVLNINGYIGESTRSEIEYAEKIGKRVLYHEPEPENTVRRNEKGYILTDLTKEDNPFIGQNNHRLCHCGHSYGEHEPNGGACTKYDECLRGQCQCSKFHTPKPKK